MRTRKSIPISALHQLRSWLGLDVGGGANRKRRSGNFECTSRHCRSRSRKIENYRALNQELTAQVESLRWAQASNAEYKAMFDRFVLKSSQGNLRVEVLKKKFEESYDVLMQLETLMQCFSDAERLRAYLLDEETIHLGVCPSDLPIPEPQSPFAEKPEKQHKPFREDCLMPTIVEEAVEVDTPPIITRRKSRRKTIVPIRGDVLTSECMDHSGAEDHERGGRNSMTNDEPPKAKDNRDETRMIHSIEQAAGTTQDTVGDSRIEAALSNDSVNDPNESRNSSPSFDINPRQNRISPKIRGNRMSQSEAPMYPEEELPPEEESQGQSSIACPQDTPELPAAQRTMFPQPVVVTGYTSDPFPTSTPFSRPKLPSPDLSTIAPRLRLDYTCVSPDASKELSPDGKDPMNDYHLKLPGAITRRRKVASPRGALSKSVRFSSPLGSERKFRRDSDDDDSDGSTSSPAVAGVSSPLIKNASECQDPKNAHTEAERDQENRPDARKNGRNRKKDEVPRRNRKASDNRPQEEPTNEGPRPSATFVVGQKKSSSTTRKPAKSSTSAVKNQATAKRSRVDDDKTSNEIDASKRRRSSEFPDSMYAASDSRSTNGSCTPSISIASSGRPHRSTRSKVPYVEPSLRSKMRRD